MSYDAQWKVVWEAIWGGEIEGKSVEEVSEMIDVEKDIIEEWLKSSKEFREAFERAQRGEFEEIEVVESITADIVDKYGNRIDNNLTDIQREVIRLAAGELKTVDEVAIKLGISKDDIRDWIKNDEEFRYELDMALLCVPKMIAPKAFRVLLELMDGDYPTERLKAAHIALQIAGYAKSPELNVNISNDDNMKWLEEITNKAMLEYEKENEAKKREESE